MRAKRWSDEMMASHATPGSSTEMRAWTKVPRRDEKLIEDGASALMCMNPPGAGADVDHAVLALEKWLGCVSVVLCGTTASLHTSLCVRMNAKLASFTIQRTNGIILRCFDQRESKLRENKL